MLFRKIGLFIAEDEPVVLKMLSDAVATLGEPYELLGTAYNGRSAYEQILALKPDILLTDIRMPMMNGLDLIRSVHEAGVAVRPVIISGFDDFEYARTAMRLDVKDYLLKPIDKDQMLAVIVSIGSQLKEQRKFEWIHRIKACIGLEEDLFIRGNPFAGLTLQVFFAYLGPLARRIYGELGQGSSYWQTSDLSFADRLADKHACMIFHFQGKYPNERIFVAVWPGRDSSQRQQLPQELFSCLPQKLSANLVCSKIVDSCQALSDSAIQAALFAVSAIPFGRSQVFWLDDWHEQSPMPQIDDGFRNQVKALVYLLGTGHPVQSVLKTIISQWDSRQVPQIQLQAELEYLLQHVLANSHIPTISMPDPSELIASAIQYQELEQQLHHEISRICLPAESSAGSKASTAKDVVYQIEQYLKDNMSLPMTYQDLSDHFGYNEKYLADLFKKAVGMSPSQYLTTIRIRQAQELLLQNPSLMLKDVAQMVGYSDPFYFSRVFKDVTGQSPSIYARKAMQPDPE